MVRKLAHAFVITGLVSGILSLFFLLGFFQAWQLALSDNLFTPRKPNSSIVIIAIDDKSIQAIGRWPWDRSIHAQLLNLLTTAKPKAIGIDISFFEPSNSTSDQQFAGAIRQAGNITLAAEEVDNQIYLPINSLAQFAKVGIVNTEADPDGITRTVHTKFADLYPHFALATAGLTPPNGILRINYVGGVKSFPYYSYVDVLQGSISPENLKDKIVLIGATTPDLHDDQLVPTSKSTPMPGIEIHANIIDTLLSGKPLNSVRNRIVIIFTVAFALTISLLAIFTGILPTIIAAVVLLIGYLVYAVVSFDSGLIQNLVLPPLAVIAATIAGIIYRYLAESNQKRFIKKAFAHYLSASVLNEILAHPAKLKLGGERKKITVLFSDIAGFTTISESTAPEPLAHALNEYLTRMTEIIFAHDGVLDKFIGDAVMAFWGAPIVDADQALNACRAALEMQSAGVDSQFQTRIGINTGEMIVGNMGSDQRFDYTLLGDNVNLGSRLEGINKQYGTKIIISESTYQEVKDQVVVRKLDRVAVKGKRVGVTIYELRNLGKPSEEEKLFLEGFETARKLYESGKFTQALGKFKLLLKAQPDDGPTQIYIERCQSLIRQKPKGWDGIFHATAK